MDRALVGLADAVAALRDELTQAIGEGKERGMQFRLDPIELTVQAVLEKDGNGKIGWKVLEASGSMKAVTTQTLTLRLTPMWKREGGSLTEDFTISSVAKDAGDQVGPRSGVQL